MQSYITHTYRDYVLGCCNNRPIGAKGSLGMGWGGGLGDGRGARGWGCSDCVSGYGLFAFLFSGLKAGDSLQEVWTDWGAEKWSLVEGGDGRERGGGGLLGSGYKRVASLRVLRAKREGLGGKRQEIQEALDKKSTDKKFSQIGSSARDRIWNLARCQIE